MKPVRTNLLAFLLLIQSTASAMNCAGLFGKLGTEDVFTQQPSFRNALAAVLETRLKESRPVPPLSEQTIQTVRHDGDGVIAAFHDLYPVKETFGTVENPVPHKSNAQYVYFVLQNGARIADHISNQANYAGKIASIEPLPMDRLDVAEIETPRGKRFFRAIDNGLDGGLLKARTELAASAMNQALKRKVVPQTVWGVVNGYRGAISKEAVGYEPKKNLKEMAKEGKVDERSLADAEAFEFLVGNYDGDLRNIRIGPKGEVIVFDHDHAFVHGFVNLKLPSSPKEAWLGVQLPERYTREFAKSLNDLTPKKIRQKVDRFLSETEIESIILRREVILKDMELRGESCFFTAP